jgi:hypothetical protein
LALSVSEKNHHYYHSEGSGCDCTDYERQLPRHSLPVDAGRAQFGDQLYATVTKEVIEAARENLVPGQA